MEENNNNAALVEDILKHAKNDEIIIMTIEGAKVAKIEDFANQPADGMLYDLNRDLATLATQANASKSLRFVNDFASAFVIKHLARKVKELENKIASMESNAKQPALAEQLKMASKPAKKASSSWQEGFNTSLEIDM